MPRRRTLKQKTLLGFLSSSPPPSPPKRRRTRASSTSSSSSQIDQIVLANDSDSDVRAIGFEPEAVETSGDSDQSPRRPKHRSGLFGGAHASSKRASSDDSLEETLIVPRIRKGKNKRILDSDSDDPQPLKRKLIKGIRPPTPEDDDEDILDGKHQVLESRFRSRGKMTPYQKHLEKFKMLKGKKRGKIELESASESEQSVTSATVPFKGAKPHRSGESDTSDDETDSNDNENDFIVDDDPLGVAPAQLPLAFSMSTHQDLAHQFKIVCQLFVHMAVRPLVERRPFLEHVLKEEEYFSVPLQVARRNLSGMRDSLVASSVWRSDFKKTLETYPKFTLIAMEFAMPHCDACHLGGRVSTLLGRFSGMPYDEYDFEDISDDESHQSDEDKESDEEDVQREVHLGRFCAARTRAYHQFSHWERSLYKALQREILEAQDESQRFVKVAYFGGIKPPRDLHDADRVMEWLDQRGIIDREWQNVREMMERAHKLQRGEVDEDGILS